MAVSNNRSSTVLVTNVGERGQVAVYLGVQGSGKKTTCASSDEIREDVGGINWMKGRRRSSFRHVAYPSPVAGAWGVLVMLDTKGTPRFFQVSSVHNIWSYLPSIENERETPLLLVLPWTDPCDAVNARWLRGKVVRTGDEAITPKAEPPAILDALKLSRESVLELRPEVSFNP